MKIVLCFYIVICSFCLTISCSSSSDILLKEHRTETYALDPSIETKSISKTQYSIDSIRSFVFPDSIKEIGIDKICNANGCTYIMDSGITKSIYVFDSNGHLKFRIGERGRAKGEFIGQPNEFFVDINNKIYVHDELGRQIIIFNEDATVNKVIQLDKYYPLSFGLTRNNKFMMYCNHEEEDNVLMPTLSVFNCEFKKEEELLSLNYDIRYRFPTLSFSQNDDRMFHIPPFADSIIVFRNDTLEKVVLFDFKGKILCKEHPELLRQHEDDSFLNNYTEVLGLHRYQENKSLIYMQYIHNNASKYWLYNKKNNLFYNGKNIFEGVNPYSYYFLNDNQIVAYIETKTMETFKGFQKYKEFRENLEKSPEQIKDVIKGKIKTPALVYITIK